MSSEREPYPLWVVKSRLQQVVCFWLKAVVGRVRYPRLTRVLPGPLPLTVQARPATPLATGIQI